MTTAILLTIYGTVRYIIPAVVTRKEFIGLLNEVPQVLMVRIGAEDLLPSPYAAYDHCRQMQVDPM